MSKIIKNKIQKHKWTEGQSKSAQTPNFGKKYIGELELLRMLGEVKGKKVLELGCGNGYWLNLLAKKGAVCVGIEKSKNQLDLIDRNNSKINYLLGDITQLNKLNLKNNSFDIILLEHVLLEINSLKKIQKIFSDSFSLLKNSGVIIISDLHPFAPSLKYKNIKTKSDYNYFSSGSVFQIISKRIDGKETVYQDFHWTLSDITGSLNKVNFLISEITEPTPSLKIVKKYPELAYRKEIPMSFWIKGVKKIK